jgi:hypothetical protein
MHIFGVFLLFFVIAHSQVNWDATFMANKEQAIPKVTMAQAECNVDISFDYSANFLVVNVDCGAGLGSPITAAHIHKSSTTPLCLGSGANLIDLVTAQISGNTFNFQNSTLVPVDFICDDQAYLNIHCLDSNYNVRANLVGMQGICNLGKEPTVTTVQEWGATAAVGEMKSWTLKVDIVDPSDPNVKCSGRITYEPGSFYVSGACTGLAGDITKISVYSSADFNTTSLFDLFDYTAPGLTSFTAVIPYSFEVPLDKPKRDELCKSTAASGTWYAVIETNAVVLSGKIDIDKCPVVTPPTSTPAGAFTLSFTVYLTVILALFAKWLY